MADTARLISGLTNVRDAIASSGVAGAHQAVQGLNMLISALPNATHGLAQAAERIVEHFDHNMALNIGMVTIVGGLLVLLPPLALSVAGFSTVGPVAGSIAAAWQASFGGTVFAGSAFSMCQSIAMSGLGATLTGVGSTLAGMGTTLIGLGGAAALAAPGEAASEAETMGQVRV